MGSCYEGRVFGKWEIIPSIFVRPCSSTPLNVEVSSSWEQDIQPFTPTVALGNKISLLLMKCTCKSGVVLLDAVQQGKCKWGIKESQCSRSGRINCIRRLGSVFRRKTEKQVQQVQCSTGFDAVKRRGTQQECPYAVENCEHWELWNTLWYTRLSSKFKMLWKIGCC
ncbi:unnamed protein product [Sphagnum troendelagicum]